MLGQGIPSMISNVHENLLLTHRRIKIQSAAQAPYVLEAQLIKLAQ